MGKQTTFQAAPKKPGQILFGTTNKLIEVPGVAGNRSAASETNFTSLDICALQPHPGRQKIHDLHTPLSRCFVSD